MSDFPYEGFPYRLEYTDGKDERVCWFMCEEHLQKHIERYKPTNASIQTIKQKQKKQLFSELDTFFTSDETPVAPVGTRTRRKSTQKRPSS